MSGIPIWVTAACRAWVLDRAKTAGEPPPSEFELKARVMRMTREQIAEARRPYESLYGKAAA